MQARALGHALHPVCQHRAVDRQVVESVPHPLGRQVTTDMAGAGVAHLQPIQRVVEVAEAATQSKKLKLAKHDEPPTL